MSDMLNKVSDEIKTQLKTVSLGSALTYSELLKAGDGETGLNPHKDGSVWYFVYLDNARGTETDYEFRGRLAALSKAGLYKPYDGYAWGELRLS